MKKLIFLVLLLIIPITVKADCTSIEVSKLKALASNISVTYNYTETDKTLVFDVILHNISTGLRVKNISSSGYYATKDGNVTIKGISPGTILKVSIESTKCSDTNIFTKYISTPYFNSYYNDPLCDGNETMKVCQKWINTSGISYNSFVNSFKTDEPVVEPVVETEKTFFEILGDLFTQYYYVIYGVIILVCIFIIIENYRKDRFDF